MPDPEGSEPPRRVQPPPRVAQAPDAAADLAAAIGGLDRATRNFTRRLGEARDIPTPAVTADDRPLSHLPARAPSPEPARAPTEAPRRGADAAFDERMRDAEREAREYLERAKQRADALVASMVGAVDREATAIRRDAEEGIRARWQQVEGEAQRHLEEARRVGDGMVAERQHRLAVLSDGIAGRAEALTAGLEDADRVRAQFGEFLRALSATANRIATEPTAASGEPARLRRRPTAAPGPSAIAA